MASARRPLALAHRAAPAGSLRSLTLGLVLIYLMLIPPGIVVIDPISMFATAEALATGLNLHVPCEVSGYDALPGVEPDREAVTGRGGRCYSIWYPLGPLVAAPLAAAGHALADVAGQPGSNVAALFALIVPALATAGAAVLTAALALELGASRRGAVGAAVAFGFGTEALTYSRTFFAEPLSAFLVALGVWGLLGQRRRRMLALAALALAVLAKPQLVVVGPALGATLALQRRSVRPLWAPTAASAAGAIAYLAFNWLRFADALNFGGNTERVDIGRYLQPGAIAETLGVLLVSPGRGLLWYSPVVIVAGVMLWRLRRHPVGQLCVAGFAAVLVVYIGHYRATGGEDWGDRFLLPSLPLVCAAVGLASPRLARAAVVLVVVGALSQIPTTAAFYPRTYAEHREQGIQLPDRRWSLADSPLVSSWPAMINQVRDATRRDVRDLSRAASTSRARGLRDTQLLHVVALWWWLLPVVGIAWWIGAAFAAAVMAGGVLLVVRAAREHRTHSA